MSTRITKQQREKGFTLVELMVSLTVFSIVMTISVGTLLVLIDLNSKAQAVYSATTNLSFALDSMTREIRTGYRYYCKESSGNPEEALPDSTVTNDCDAGDFVSFIREEDDVRMGYRLDEATHAIEQKESSGNWVPITADDVSVDEFSVTVDNSTTYSPGNDEEQPTADIVVKGHVNNGLDTDTDFYIQTHIVQRRLDII
ncbi:MAG TPA: type II secretion system protein [Candidatus Paceibacterota bacterium]|nr:type II secretion system protein [Candidatus Paceibacterota bacterium]